MVGHLGVNKPNKAMPITTTSTADGDLVWNISKHDAVNAIRALKSACFAKEDIAAEALAPHLDWLREASRRFANSQFHNHATSARVGKVSFERGGKTVSQYKLVYTTAKFGDDERSISVNAHNKASYGCLDVSGMLFDDDAELDPDAAVLPSLAPSKNKKVVSIKKSARFKQHA